MKASSAITSLFFSLTLALGAGCTSDGAAPGELGESSRELERPTALLWSLVTIENCNDVFAQPCTSSFPAPQCLRVSPQGKICGDLGDICFKTQPGGGEYHEYHCEGTPP